MENERRARANTHDARDEEARGIYYGAVAGLILRPAATNSKHAYSVCDVYIRRGLHARLFHACVRLTLCSCTQGGTYGGGGDESMDITADRCTTAPSKFDSVTRLES